MSGRAWSDSERSLMTELKFGDPSFRRSRNNPRTPSSNATPGTSAARCQSAVPAAVELAAAAVREDRATPEPIRAGAAAVLQRGQRGAVRQATADQHELGLDSEHSTQLKKRDMLLCRGPIPEELVRRSFEGLGDADDGRQAEVAVLPALDGVES